MAQVGGIPFDPIKILPKPLPTSQENEDNQSKRIEIIHADSLKQYTDTTTQLIKRKLIHRVKLSHENAIMTCDSAILFPQNNYLEAHGRVRINKSDSIKISSHTLNYDGHTKIATLKGEVILTTQEMILQAPRMTYDVHQDLGHFWDNGTLTTDSTTLTSISGTYYHHLNQTIFRGDVVLKSPDYTMYADSMKYDSENKIAHFITETMIISDQDTIITSDGYFDTEKNVTILKGRPFVKNGEDNTLQSDFLDYDKKLGQGEARGQVVSKNKKENMVLLANLIHYVDSNNYTHATQDPLLIKYEEKDTLYISADTLINYSAPRSLFISQSTRDSINWDELHIVHTMLNSKNLATTLVQDSILLTHLIKPSQKQTIKVETSQPDSSTYKNISDTLHLSLGDKPITQVDEESDSVQIFLAYRDVRLIRANMSGICDSLYYSSIDSIFRLHQQPILWMDSTQMQSDSIYIYMKDDEAEKVELFNHAIIIHENDPGVYNQIAGKKITAWFRDNHLTHVLVDGNAESIYFLKNDSNQYLGGNHAIGAWINVTFNDSNEVQKINVSKSPEAKFTPIQQIHFDSYRLPNFAWYWSYKPHTKWDVIRDSIQYQKYLLENPDVLPKDSIITTELDLLNETQETIHDSSQSEEIPETIPLEDATPAILPTKEKRKIKDRK